MTRKPWQFDDEAGEVDGPPFPASLPAMPSVLRDDEGDEQEEQDR